MSQITFFPFWRPTWLTEIKLISSCFPPRILEFSVNLQFVLFWRYVGRDMENGAFVGYVIVTGLFYLSTTSLISTAVKLLYWALNLSWLEYVGTNQHVSRHNKLHRNAYRVYVSWKYRQTFNIIPILLGNKSVDHPVVVGASPVGTSAITSAFSTQHQASMEWAKTSARRDEKKIGFGFGAPYIRGLTVLHFFSIQMWLLCTVQ